MRYNILINQIKALEWELNLSEAYIFGFFYELPSWAESMAFDGKTFYYSAKSKVITELPMLTDKIDTVYRLMKSLESKELIEIIKVGNKDYIRTTSKGKAWNKIGNKSDMLEINPENIGNKSEKISETNPTYNTTIDNSTNNKGTSSPAEKLKIKKEKFYKDLRAYQKENINKYPAGLYKKFISYWTEVHKNGKKIRLDDHDYFDIGRRLSTFWGFTKEEERNTLWKDHNDANQKLTLDL